MEVVIKVGTSPLADQDNVHQTELVVEYRRGGGGGEGEGGGTGGDDLEPEKPVDEPEKVKVAPPEQEDEQQWSNKMAYMCTLIGYAVGFGNIWRFPFVMRDNGGIAFLIPYCFMLVTIGIPTFFLELAVGQRRRKGIIYCWKEISPAFGGLGICCGFITFFIGMYYNTLLAYCISYLVDSFFSPLPWTNCTTVSSNVASQTECHELLDDRSTKYYWFRAVLKVSDGIDQPGLYNWPLAGYHVVAWALVLGVLIKGTASVEYVVYFTSLFPYLVLVIFFVGNFFVNNPSEAWHGAYRLTKPDWSRLLDPCVWLKAGSQIFFSLGLAEGALVVFASHMPPRNDCHMDSVLISTINCGTSVFAALVIFPIIGQLGYNHWKECKVDMMNIILNHTNLWNNIGDNKYDIYFVVDENKVGTWSQISEEFPLKIRYGYGELGREKNNWNMKQENEHVETITDPSFINSEFWDHSVKATIRDCSIGEAAAASGGGTGLVFEGFTQAAMQMKGANFWSIMFFVMMFLLGIDSGFGTVEATVAAMQDLTKLSRGFCTCAMCGILTVIALLVYPYGWGIYVLNLVDQWPANWTLLMIALAECIAVAWFHGLAQFSYDVQLMTGKKPNLYVLTCWKYITPLLILAMFIGTIVEFINDSKTGLVYSVFRPNESRIKEEDFDGELKTPYPWFSITIAFAIMIICMMWIPIQAILRKTNYNLVKDEPLAEFPEEELRVEHGLDVATNEGKKFTKWEKLLIGASSLKRFQEQGNKQEENILRKSQRTLSSRTSTKGSVLNTLVPEGDQSQGQGQPAQPPKKSS